MLDLVRLSRRPLFPPGGEALYRQIAVLTGMGEGTEVLDVGCGAAVTLEYFAREYGVHGSGIDGDETLVAIGAERLRDRELADQVQVQHAPSDALPYRDEIFDVTVGEIGMTADVDPVAAVREAVRVTRPGGAVVLVQLVWLAPVDPPRRALLAEHLGVRPHMLVEWKRLLRESGVVDLHTEDWSDPDTAFRPAGVKPFPDFAELFSLREKLGILHRAWKRWGWTGVRTAVAREREVHRLLTRERILGLDLIKGVKAGTTPDSAASLDPDPEIRSAPDPDTPSAPDSAPSRPDSPETQGLPLFSPKSQ